MCYEEQEDITSVSVTYDLTSLTAEGNAELLDLVGTFPEFLQDWERAIQDAIAGPHRRGNDV